MMLGRINEGRIFVRTVPSPRCVYRVWTSEKEREKDGIWKEGRRKERGRGLSLYTINAAGVEGQRQVHPPVPGVRVDRLDLLRLCLFMPALSFIFVHPPSPLSIPLLRLAYVWPLQMNGITLSVSRGEEGCKEEILRRQDESDGEEVSSQVEKLYALYADLYGR